MAKKEKVDPRMEAFLALEGAFRDHNWEAFGAAAEALAKVAHEMGEAGEAYKPMFKTRPQEPVAPPPERGDYTVSHLDAAAVRFKQGATLFTVITPGGNANSMADIVGFFDTEEKAALVARALSEYGGKDGH